MGSEQLVITDNFTTCKMRKMLKTLALGQELITNLHGAGMGRQYYYCVFRNSNILFDMQ